MTLPKFINTAKTYLHLFRFYSGVQHKSPHRGRVLMHVGIGNMYLTPVEILLYHLLKARGYQVDYCIYDSTIPINEVITKSRLANDSNHLFWRRSVRKAKIILSICGVKYQFIRPKVDVRTHITKRLDESETSPRNFVFDGVDFGSIVEGVMYRYYKSLSFDEDAPSVADRFLETSLTNYLFVREKLQEQKYDYVLFSHGIYCTWEPVVELCRVNDIPFVCYDRAKMKNHCNFNLNRPSPDWDISEAWERLSDYQLSKIESSKVSKYLEERELQKGDVYAYNFTAKADNLTRLKAELSIQPGSKVITVFTNLIWDAANVSRDIAFASPLDCIQQLIKRYENRNDIHILVRPHPAEVVLGTSERYEELILDAFNRNLPNNVTIIGHELTVNSFSVLEVTDIGVIHTSTVGLELALEDKPTILISETHYRGKGFTFDAESADDFFKTIEDLLLEKLSQPNRIALARKYFYLMMFEYQHKIPTQYHSNGAFKRYTFSNFDDYLKDSNQSLSKIVDRISDGKPFEDFIWKQ